VGLRIGFRSERELRRVNPGHEGPSCGSAGIRWKTATDLIEDSYATASRGAADYNLKLIEAARANTNAHFDYAGQLLGAKSLSEAVELSTAHLRKQFDILSTQTKELTALAQRVATDTVEPLKESVNSAFKKVA
jgi:phasin